MSSETTAISQGLAGLTAVTVSASPGFHLQKIHLPTPAFHGEGDSGVAGPSV